jgi:uncharacterized protein YutE (UPF0331/DUF86 family)
MNAYPVTLSRLEQNGVLHAIQVLIENAIGKAKQILKAKGEPVPVSAYDALAALARLRVISDADLPAWNAAIGLRNRIVHEYMNIDIKRALELVRANQHGKTITDPIFLFTMLVINSGIMPVIA